MKEKVIQIYEEIIIIIGSFVLFLFWGILAYSVIQIIFFGEIKTGFSMIIHDKDLPMIINDCKDLPINK